MSFRVLMALLDRLFDFIIEREVALETPDRSIADRVLQAIRDGDPGVRDTWRLR